jgi:hypothetical protein
MAKTLTWIPRVRVMRAKKMTLQEIADVFGCSKFRIWQICHQEGIASARDWGPKKHDPRRYSPAPIDPAKAAALTEAKRRYWEGAA